MNDNYVSDLIARMSDLDQAWNANREAEALDDLATLDQIRPLVVAARKSNEIQGLSKILVCLARNTKHPEPASLYAELLKKPRLTGETIMYLIEHAVQAGFTEFAPWVRLQLQHKSSVVVSEAIKYLGFTGHPEDLTTIGEFLDRDCDGRCHPMYCIFAFQENGRREGIPYIERAIARHADGRKKVDQEICGFGEMALEKFAGIPSKIYVKDDNGKLRLHATIELDGTVTPNQATEDRKH